MTQTPSVARRVLEAAAESGNRTVFGLPGVHNLAFWRETGSELPRIVGVRHEQTTVYAADGLARATGRVSFALTTTGPGAANAAGAFGEAAASSSPVILIASDVSTQLRKGDQQRGLLHESSNQAGIFEPLAKGVFRPRTPDEVISALEDAVDLSTRSPQGPVFVDIPTDVLSLPAEPARSRPSAPIEPLSADIAALRDLIQGAGEIVIWAGRGAVQADAGPEIAQLAELIQAPVVTTYGGRACLPPRHPLNIGVPPHEPEVADLIGRADLMLVVGSDLDGVMTRHWKMPTARRMAIIDVEPSRPGINYTADLIVKSDAKLALAQLLNEPPRSRGKSSVGQNLTEEVRDRIASDPRTSSAAEFLASVEASLLPETILINDMTIPAYWLAGYADISRPRAMQTPIGWGTLGFALPASIGPATLPDSKVIAVCGDGGFMYGIGELATLVQEGLAVTILLVDDGGYGMLRFDQLSSGDEPSGVDLVRPDFRLLGQSFGIRVTEVESLGPRLTDALLMAQDSDRPEIVLCRQSLYPPRTVSARWAE